MSRSCHFENTEECSALKIAQLLSLARRCKLKRSLHGKRLKKTELCEAFVNPQPHLAPVLFDDIAKLAAKHANWKAAIDLHYPSGSSSSPSVQDLIDYLKQPVSVKNWKQLEDETKTLEDKIAKAAPHLSKEWDDIANLLRDLLNKKEKKETRRTSPCSYDSVPIMIKKWFEAPPDEDKVWKTKEILCSVGVTGGSQFHAGQILTDSSGKKWNVFAQDRPHTAIGLLKNDEDETMTRRLAKLAAAGLQYAMSAFVAALRQLLYVCKALWDILRIGFHYSGSKLLTLMLVAALAAVLLFIVSPSSFSILPESLQTWLESALLQLGGALAIIKGSEQTSAPRAIAQHLQTQIVNISRMMGLDKVLATNTPDHVPPPKIIIPTATIENAKAEVIREASTDPSNWDVIPSPVQEAIKHASTLMPKELGTPHYVAGAVGAAAVLGPTVLGPLAMKGVQGHLAVLAANMIPTLTNFLYTFTL